MNKKTVVLAHYYTDPEVQDEADRVGDSLDLADWAEKNKPERIVFAGVKFMAETAKVLNPEAEVILPDMGSTCSLVEQTDIHQLRKWVEHYRHLSSLPSDYASAISGEVVHVAYINSSAEHKATADIIVTSRIVDDVVRTLKEQGKYVIFSPDFNMGQYLNYSLNMAMPVWSAVCEVHDKFKAEALDQAIEDLGNTPYYVLAHPESPLPVLRRAHYVGSTHGMLNWIRNYSGSVATILVATEEGLLYNMRQLRPELNIIQAPTYSGCACNVCPYMKKNTVENVRRARDEGKGFVIDYLTDKQIEAALKPIQRMIEFQRTGIINLDN